MPGRRCRWSSLFLMVVLPILCMGFGFPVEWLLDDSLDALSCASRRVPDEVAVDAPAKPEVPWGAPAVDLKGKRQVSLVSRVTMEAWPDDHCPYQSLKAPLHLRYEKKNTGPGPLAVWHCGFWCNHRIEVVHDDGSEVPLTKAGQQGRDAFSPRGKRGKNVQWIINAGQIDATEGEYDLTKLFVLDKPGLYQVRIVYEENVKMETNTLKFWLMPKKAALALARLNQWDKDEVDVVERPAQHPDRVASGETRGYLQTWKGVLKDHGFEPTWKPTEKRYRIEQASTP